MLSNTFKRNLAALAIVASFGAGVVPDRVGVVPAIAPSPSRSQNPRRLA
jgi:hypothetical protein